MDNIVVIAVEKIQRYIFQRIDNSKKDEKTLKDVIGASNQVADDILEEIKKEFSVSISTEKKEMDTILWISGKTVFRSKLSEDEIKGKCRNLFNKIYKKYQGHIFLRYVVFEECNSNLETLRKAESELKKNQHKAKILCESQESLFSFIEVKEKPEEAYKRESNGKLWEDTFAVNMEELVVLDEKHDSDSSSGKIAIVKADVNHLGKIMSDLHCYEVYAKISRILENKISIENFSKYIKESQSEKEEHKDSNLSRKILPFYIMGDDIFYATRIDSVMDSIKVLRSMIDDINGEIKKLTKDEDTIELTLAVGVVFVDNHQPIRYYRQSVEKELSRAKITMKTQKAMEALVGISMSGNSFHIYKKNLGLGESDGFYRFVKEVEELKDMLARNVFSSTALHNLLINIEIEKDKKQQLLYALYFLKPDLRKGQLSNEELYFKYYWMSQLVEEKDEKQGKVEKDFDLTKIDSILIPKIKLVLLFLRERYSEPVAEVEYQYIKAKNTADQLRRIRSVMFHKPLNYLLNSMNNKKKTNLQEQKEDKLVKLFIKVEQKQDENDTENPKRKRLYCAVDFQPSVFFRAKTLIENGKAGQVCSLFENYNNVIQQKTKNADEPSQETTEVIENPHRISFNIKEFKNLYQEGKSGIRWLDILILAFYYNEQRIILKTVEKTEKEKASQNKKQGKKSVSDKGRKHVEKRNSKDGGLNDGMKVLGELFNNL